MKTWLPKVGPDLRMRSPNQFVENGWIIYQPVEKDIDFDSWYCGSDLSVCFKLSLAAFESRLQNSKPHIEMIRDIVTEDFSFRAISRRGNAERMCYLLLVAVCIHRMWTPITVPPPTPWVGTSERCSPQGCQIRSSHIFHQYVALSK